MASFSFLRNRSLLAAAIMLSTISYSIGAMQGNANWTLNWNPNSPSYLVLYGQHCADCGKRQKDRVVLVGEATGMRKGSDKPFQTLIATELYEWKIPTEFVENANRALEAEGAQTTQCLLDKVTFADQCKQRNKSK